MKKFVLLVIAMVLMGLSLSSFAGTAKAIDPGSGAATCSKDFLGLPTWYKYLDFESTTNCNISFTQKITVPCPKAPDTEDEKSCINENFDYGVIWKIGFAVIEMLLMLAGYIAAVFVFVGAFKFATAQGAPDAVAKARQTVTNGVVGAAIAILASKVTGYIVGKFAGGEGTYKGLITASAGSDVLKNIFNIGLTALGAISVLIIIIAGIQFIVSGSNPDKVAKARNTIYYALAGIAIAVFGGALLNFILGKL
jgi:hypothetical protein